MLAAELRLSLDAVRAFPNADWLRWAAFFKRRAAAQERALRRGGRGRGQSAPSGAAHAGGAGGGVRRVLP